MLIYWTVLYFSNDQLQLHLKKWFCGKKSTFEPGFIVFEILMISKNFKMKERWVNTCINMQYAYIFYLINF